MPPWKTSTTWRSLISNFRIQYNCATKQRPYNDRHRREIFLLHRSTTHVRQILPDECQHLKWKSGNRRTLFLDNIPTVLLPPVAFTGLFVALWTYKCMMMVLFQDKIIYMPYVPPFSRSEKIDDYANRCKPVEWKTRQIKSVDGTKITICIGHLPREKPSTASQEVKQVVTCYFQGNGSSLPPRLPLLSSVLRSIDSIGGKEISAQYTIVALSYRGYWTSSGRASQTGIELDAQALLKFVESEFLSQQGTVQIIMWGQSIGAGVASTATAAYYAQGQAERTNLIKGLVLETPFSSIRSMLSAMYPQKWLPYGYLWPFLWNHWDTETALKRIAQQKKPPRVLLIPATRDEIVPSSEADKLETLCHKIGLDTRRRDIAGALHTEATMKKAGQDIVAQFVVDVAADQES